MGKCIVLDNYLGKTYDLLTVTGIQKGDANTKTTLLANCACGTTDVKVFAHLLGGGKKSCGCLKKKPRPMSPKTNLIGQTFGKLTVLGLSQEFRDDFEVFYEYMGDPPTAKHTLERVDVNGNYERGNLKWILQEFQARNKIKQRSNTSGVTGVCWQNDNGRLSAVGYWKEFCSVKSKYVTRSKSFSANKYGSELAFELACKARNDAIRMLNEMGYGYSENHGK